MFFDHVSSNDMTQDCPAVISILDAILARLRLELPTVGGIYIFSDNARCYQNDILPVIAPFIARDHGLNLRGIVHSETQRGKSLLDAHFALAMMHVNRYCKESRQDVTTPADIVNALNSFGGVANCTAEMVHITKEHEDLLKWTEAKRKKELCALGRVNEVIYAACSEESVEATSYKLSGRSYTKYEFSLFGSSKLLVVESGAIDEPLEETEEVEGDYINDEPNTGQGVGDSNHRRPSEVAYQGKRTGILVWSRSRLRKQRKRRKHKPNNTDEIEEQTDVLLKQQMETENKEVQDLTEAPGTDDIQPVLRNCPKCGTGYRLQKALDLHVGVCKGARPSMMVADRACRMAFEMLKGSELSIYTTKTKHPAALTITIDDDVVHRMAQKRGWAQRPANGKTLGKNTVSTFADDVCG